MSSIISDIAIFIILSEVITYFTCLLINRLPPEFGAKEVALNYNVEPRRQYSRRGKF